jgi:hypothetical protein
MSYTFIRLYVISAQGASDPASPAGSDLTGLGTRRPVAPDGTGLTHVLLVTTTVGVIHGVHAHTSDLGPLVTLHPVLVEGTPGLQHRLVGTTTTGNKPDHSSALAGDGLLRAGRKADAAHALYMCMCVCDRWRSTYDVMYVSMYMDGIIAH